MLFEQIAYMENLPFELSFLNVGEESRHCHKEVEPAAIAEQTGDPEATAGEACH